MNVSALGDLNANSSGNVFFSFLKAQMEVIAYATLDINGNEFGIA